MAEEYDGSGNLLRKYVYGQEIDEIRMMIAPDVADVHEDGDTTELEEFTCHHGHHHYGRKEVPTT